MKPDRILVVGQTVVAVAVLAAVSALLAGGVPGPDALLPTAPSAAGLGVALLVLGFFNVWLPRGDAVDTTVPIAFAAGAMLHPLIAAGVVLLARSATVALRPKGHTLFTAIEQVGRRTILMSATYAVLRQQIVQGMDPQRPWAWLAQVLAAAAVFVALDALVEQVHASVRFRTPLKALLAGAIRLRGWMLAAEISTGVLTVVLFRDLGAWGLLVTVGLLLVMRQSFALLLEVRASYTSTVEVLARSLEAYDPGRRGHAERVAHMGTQAGRMIGLQGKRLESLTYAALFHDVGRLGSDDPTGPPEHSSAEVLGSVGFLSGALPILRVLDTAAEDETSLDEDDLISAYLVARFSALDSELNSGVLESAELANAIGARLYASTRAAVERAVSRVEREARSGSLPAADLADVLT
jgi:hypothetical protein